MDTTKGLVSMQLAEKAAKMIIEEEKKVQAEETKLPKVAYANRLVRSLVPPGNFPVYVLEAVADKDMPTTVTPLHETFKYDTTIDLVIFARDKEKVMRFPCVSLAVAEELLQRIADNVLLEELKKGENKDLGTWARHIIVKPWNRMVYFLRIRPEYKPVFFAPKHLTEGLLARAKAVTAERITLESMGDFSARVDFPAEMLV